MIIAVASAPALSSCGGAEFGTVDPTMDPDAAGDTMTPSSDQNSTGGRGGSGGSGGIGGTGGKSGGGGTGGAVGRGGGDSAVDGKIDGPGVSDGAPSDNGTPDPGDGRSGDVTSDGAPRDVDAGHPSDAADVPTSTDAKDASDASSRSDSDAAGGSADAVCSEPITYYKDADGDGFGKYTEMMLSCPPPGNGWSATGGDCRDDLPNVKPFVSGAPNPPLYSGTGYVDASKPQGVFFDYDCTGAEEADPSNSYGLEPDCALLNCSGVGYVAVNPSRNGPGIDPRCGSMTLTRCNGNVLNCKSLPEATTIPYRCR